MLSIRRPADIEDRLEQLAKATGRTKAFYAREAILQRLEDLEDGYLAEQALIELREGRSRAYTIDEVARDLGLEDCVRERRDQEVEVRTCRRAWFDWMLIPSRGATPVRPH